MDSILVINLALVAFLIVLTAFFVGSEFAVIKVRMSRIDQLISEGNKKAVIVKKLVNDLDYYLSACQLGITVTALGLGWLGEPTVEKILHPLFHQFGIPDAVSTVISIAIAFALVTFLHVVIGELAPKTLAIQYAEEMTMVFARPLYWFGKIMAPLIWTLNGSARVMLRIFGVQPATHEQAHSEEELKIIMSQSYQSGEINQTELSYMQNIFDFDERVAKDIMVPRMQVVTLTQAMSRDEVIAFVDEHQYTRYPVTADGDKDHIIGFVNVKEMLTSYAAGRERKLVDFVHEMPMIHEVTPLQDVLLKMKQDRVHIAVVIDEYGGTAGVITMEDILEEIVGEIRDEFDDDEVPDIQQQSDSIYHINGRVLLSDLEKQFGLTFEESEEVDTIGGWIQVQNNEIAESDFIDHGEHRWVVIEMDNHQIKQVALELRTAA
ncbi:MULTISPECIES: hemolysin family protein [Bacillus]|uniref:Transporter associated domain protein n=2 Tax=Bacillus TaxID=1386 RepID=A0A0M4GB86_9BACI|nr:MULTISPECIES: hemolysin family protein [Bacillus]ALC82920.1 transporter associated domain protein [Bacillus gobiensis]MBP1081901.1 CBS domain containing-hemolysin-like protein [Bacillus capparidis]MED1096548.1 hemolysin family protein [Bacillus capparidis]